MSLIGVLTTFAVYRVTSDIDEIKSDNKSTAAAIAAQNTRIAVIEATTQRTEALVKEDAADLKSQRERLSKVEHRCCDR